MKNIQLSDEDMEQFDKVKDYFGFKGRPELIRALVRKQLGWILCEDSKRLDESKL